MAKIAAFSASCFLLAVAVHEVASQVDQNSNLHIDILFSSRTVSVSDKSKSNKTVKCSERQTQNE